MQNRWGGFKALRTRWADHIASCEIRPILIIDEAQEMLDPVWNELRIMSSKDFDSQSLLSVVFAGDARLPDRFRHADMLPLGTRIRRRLLLDYTSREDLLATLNKVLEAAGNTALVTKELKETLVDQAAGNFRVMMNTAEELLTAAFDREQPVLDDKLFLEVFVPNTPRKLQKRR
jgi:type II secretory pathway predicted ATPase ExeA